MKLVQHATMACTCRASLECDGGDLFWREIVLFFLHHVQCGELHRLRGRGVCGDSATTTPAHDQHHHDCQHSQSNNHRDRSNHANSSNWSCRSRWWLGWARGWWRVVWYDMVQQQQHKNHSPQAKGMVVGVAGLGAMVGEVHQWHCPEK